MSIRFELPEVKQIILEQFMRRGLPIQEALEKAKQRYPELFQEDQKQKKPSKYRNEITWMDGYCFRSRKEADYYLYLKQLHAIGEIAGYGVQSPEFILTTGDDKDHRAITYTADFIVFHNGEILKNGTYEIIDTKGVKHKEWIRISKMMREKYPKIEIKVI
jgi:allantoicase